MKVLIGAAVLWLVARHRVQTYIGFATTKGGGTTSTKSVN